MWNVFVLLVWAWGLIGLGIIAGYLFIMVYKKIKETIKHNNDCTCESINSEETDNYPEDVNWVKEEGSKCNYCAEKPIGYVDLLNSYVTYKKNKKTGRFKKSDSGISECCNRIYFCKDHEDDAISE